MPSIGTRYIEFGLVTIPVKLHPAIKEQRVKGTLVETNTQQPVALAKMAGAEAVPASDVTTSYQASSGAQVVLDKATLKRLIAKLRPHIPVVWCCPPSEIPVRFWAGKLYYLAPDRIGAAKGYIALRDALVSTGSVAIVQFVAKGNRQYFGALMPHGDVLCLQQLHYPVDIRDADEITVQPSVIDPQERALARQLVELSQAAFDPTKLVDTLERAKQAQIDTAASTQPTTAPAAKTWRDTGDLMAQLQKSVEKAGGGAPQPERKPAKRTAASVSKRAPLPTEELRPTGTTGRAPKAPHKKKSR